MTPVRGSMWIAAAVLAAVLAGTAAPAARADACAADARASYARVQLFKDGACSGAAVSIGFEGSGDRPDFAAFTNYEGSVFDIDDTRDSMAVAPDTCVRLFDGKSFTGEATGLLCAPAAADGLFADLGAMNNRASSMRVCPASAPSGCDPVAAPPPPAPVPNGSPARSRRAAVGAPGRQPHAPHRVVRPRRGRARRARGRRRAPGGGSGPAGAHARGPHRLGLAGRPAGHDGGRRAGAGAARSRPVAAGDRAVPRDAGRRPGRGAARVRLDVRAGVSLRVRPRRVAPGRSIRLRGRLLAAPSTRLGKVITLQARERGRWRTSRAPGPAAAGGSRRATASPPARAGRSRSAPWPAPTRAIRTRRARSRAVRVRVG